MRLFPILTLSLLLSGLSAQDNAKAVFDQMTTAQKELSAGGGRPDRAKIEAFQQSVKDALKTHEQLLATGDGVYYRGRLEMMARDTKAGAETLKSYIAANGGSDLANEARVLVAQISQREDKAGAKKLLAEVKADKLGADLKPAFENMTRSIKADETREGLTGKAAPAIPANKVLNGDAAWSLESCKGKVVVVDFWATWCPPCRAIIPDLVKLQEKHGADGLQVVGVTKYYGNGMDFSADSELPHGGKPVGGRKGSGKEMSNEEEVKVNENFIAAFKLNYPVVFTGDQIAGDSYGVMGIPTCYVIGRDGKIVGHIVGGGEAAHAKLVSMIEGALGTGAADAAHKKGD